MRVTIQTTTLNHGVNHRQEIETQEIETHIRQGSELKRQNVNRTAGKFGAPRAGKIRFKSVLTKAFALWNELDDIVGEFLKYLNADQRRNVIRNLIQFLELKVVMEDYSCKGLLSPSEAVAHVWHVLILETELYRDVVYSIQDFHARPHRFIHHALFRQYNSNEYHERLKRTQRLFKSYYGAEMPTVFTMEPDKSDLPTSVNIEETSLVSESFDELTLDKKKPAWYSLMLPTCYCFGSQNSLDYIYDQDDVSLLSTSLGLDYE
mmetsp:Transcript_13836/g.28559  ORF Transcript_13836/g.28559 Transcript_13836/m.28559 type:complete len:263 (-) Transcript_13836:205-993(-)